MVRDGEGKKHSIFFPEGKGFVNGWLILTGKLKEVGVNMLQEKEKKPPSSFECSGGCSETGRSFDEVVKYQRRGDNTIWVDTGEFHLRSSLGILKNCLGGSWKELSDSFPSTKEVESWAKAVWRLKGGLMVAFLNNDLLIFKFEGVEEANYALEGGRRTFRGGRLNLERWNPDSGCVERKNQLNKVWVRILGLPLHLWTCDVLRMIGDGCGGYLATDEETIRRTGVVMGKDFGEGRRKGEAKYSKYSIKIKKL